MKINRLYIFYSSCIFMCWVVYYIIFWNNFITDCYPQNYKTCFVHNCKAIIKDCKSCWYEEKIVWWIEINNCSEYLSSK